MFSDFFNRILSFGIKDARDQTEINRIKRINLFHLIFAALMLVSLLWAVFSQKWTIAIRDFGFLGALIAIYFLVPAPRRPNLNALLTLSLLAVFLLLAYISTIGIGSVLTLAFYLLFPLAAASITGRNGILVATGLGVLTLILNSIPGTTFSVQLGVYDAIVFFVTYGTIVLLSLYLERSNQQLLENLQDSSTRFESQVVQKDVFISKLSHKLRTSLSNITLINNLVQDSRLPSEQKELLETLKASTNNLIEDVNKIVQITSPGMADLKKSIMSFDLSRVLNESINILETEPSFQEVVRVERQDRTSNYLIGDPSLVRSLLINIVKGLSFYKQSNDRVHLKLDKLRETPNQIRIEFIFTVKSNLVKDLMSYMEALRSGKVDHASNLAIAYNLLQDSEGALKAKSLEDNLVQIQFYQDFAKDVTRTVGLPSSQDAGEKKFQKRGIPLMEAKVLLVEDNEINQKIVLLSLSRKVKDIQVAANGQEALNLFFLNEYDMILMDIKMPVMDGLTATKKIREIEAANESHVPIITITANALAGDREQCLAAGADDYIAKPFQAEVLIKKMKYLL